MIANNGFNNPFGYGSFNNGTQLQRYHIDRVNGVEDVNKFQMLPNSETILLDTTAPLVWLVQTDNFGNMTTAPFTITPYTPPKPVDVNDLMVEIKALREELENVKSGKSYVSENGANEDERSC